MMHGWLFFGWSCHFLHTSPSRRRLSEMAPVDRFFLALILVKYGFYTLEFYNVRPPIAKLVYNSNNYGLWYL